MRLNIFHNHEIFLPPPWFLPEFYFIVTEPECLVIIRMNPEMSRHVTSRLPPLDHGNYIVNEILFQDTVCRVLPVLPDPVEEGAELAPGNVQPGPEPLPRPALGRVSHIHVETLVQVPDQRRPEVRQQCDHVLMRGLLRDAGGRGRVKAALRGVRGHQDLGDGDPELSSHSWSECVTGLHYTPHTSPDSVPAQPLLSLPSLNSPVMQVARSG